MVIIRLWGGIGNQLFQYSFGEYLRKITQQEIQYDISSFGKVELLRKYELAILNKNLPIVENILFSKHSGIFNRIYRFLFCLKKGNAFISEPNLDTFSFDSNKCYYLQGYWQDITFVESQSFSFFSPKEQLPPKLENILNEINACKNATSIHVRRGDYFHPKNIKKYGICNVDYYNQAINEILNVCSDTRFFIFSDDLNWVQNNLLLPPDSFLVPNYDINSYWYIYLMSHCNHNIISNSTFSWWGAWLNRNINKKVITPRIWYQGTLNNEIEVLIPTSWTKL